MALLIRVRQLQLSHKLGKCTMLIERFAKYKLCHGFANGTAAIVESLNKNTSQTGYSNAKNKTFWNLPKIVSRKCDFW